jgi:hypothetical protein
MKLTGIVEILHDRYKKRAFVTFNNELIAVMSLRRQLAQKGKDLLRSGKGFETAEGNSLNEILIVIYCIVSV